MSKSTIYASTKKAKDNLSKYMEAKKNKCKSGCGCEVKPQKKENAPKENGGA